MAAKPKGRGTGPLPQEEMRTLTGLEQVKVLADPLRIRLLEAFCEQERTTKQVAELLGEKPTKLYHHVDALERVGLISLVRTRQNRGTMEKYYRAVARAFRADSRIFNAAEKPESEGRATFRRMISMIIDQTAAELTALVDRAGDGSEGTEDESIVTFLEVRATKKEIAAIRSKLRALQKSVTAASKNEGKEPAERYRLTLACYPMDVPKRGPKSA
jgi:DNA-binding transcriptional ArsR family regulator